MIELKKRSKPLDKKSDIISSFSVLPKSREWPTKAIPWLRSKRIAFVPVYRPRAIPPDQIPNDWENLILNRVLYNPRPEANGADRSLRAWLRTVSSGRADIDPFVVPMQTIDKQDVPPYEFESTLGQPLRNQGADAAILIMLGGKGAGTNSGFWSRAVMAESNGVWLMELIHGLTGFKDLYSFTNDVDPADRDIGYFDQMSAASQTHPTVFTKKELGWIDGSAIKHHFRGTADYTIQFASLPQPPSEGRVAAVHVGDDFPYVIVEARKKTDQFETGMPSTNDGQEKGIQSEGVIAYRVQTLDPTGPRADRKKPLYLITRIACQPGHGAELDNGVRLRVNSLGPDSFTVRITSPDVVTVPSVLGADSRNARRAIMNAGLGPRFTGPMTNSEVGMQTPEGGDVVPRHTIVRMTMIKSEEF